MTKIETLGRRAAWPIFVVAVLLALSARALDIATGAQPDGGWVEEILMMIAFMGLPAAGALIASRYPRNAFAWVLLVIGVNVALLLGAMAYERYALIIRNDVTPLSTFAAWLLEWMWFAVLAPLATFMLLLFPTGRLPSRRWRPIAWLSAVMLLVLTAPSMFVERFSGEGYSLDNPIGISGLGDWEAALDPFFWVFFIITALCAASLVFRYRTARTEERLQIKWFAVAAGIFVVSSFLGDTFDLPGILFPIMLLTLPISIAVSVLKYRLYDIDVIINRTLVYGALTAVLLVSYFVIVVTLSRVLDLVTRDSDVAVAASTLAVAALFRPLRARVQGFIDRRFYRARYDATRALGEFATRLRDEVELDRVRSDVLNLVGTTLQPAHASLWVRAREVIE